MFHDGKSLGWNNTSVLAAFNLGLTSALVQIYIPKPDYFSVPCICQFNVINAGILRRHFWLSVDSVVAVHSDSENKTQQYLVKALNTFVYLVITDLKKLKQIPEIDIFELLNVYFFCPYVLDKVRVFTSCRVKLLSINLFHLLDYKSEL